MASATPYFGMAIFDFGDKLDAPLNVQREIDRFLVIDKQIYGVYNVFGNGVISGWTVKDGGFSIASGISINIEPGIGIVRFLAAETQFPIQLTGLQPNTTLNIYAVLQGSTANDRRVDFTATSLTLESDGVIKISEVVTSNEGIALIDNDKRSEIGFKEIIKQEINAHRHRGTPSKINLRDETKNQLPGAKMSDIDASKVTTGIFNIEQIPILDHSDLEFNGLINHAGLDSFVKTLNENNKQLLGEVAVVNMLRQHLFLKTKFASADEHFINELVMIPGITPQSFIDFDSSTAYIDLVNKCISGIPPKTGEFISVVWDDQTSFNNSFKKTNVIIANDKVTLSRDNESEDVIENFETVAQSGQDVPGFSKTVETIVDSMNVVAEDADTLKTEGFFSGKFTTKKEFRALFTKTFEIERDWTGFDRISVSIKCINSVHGAVYMYYTNTDGTTDTDSETFLLLAENEITDNSDSSLNDFEVKTFSISELIRNNVIKFVIFTDDVTSDFEFFVDDISVRNVALFSSQGSIRLRYSGGANVTFHSIFYELDSPTDTDVQIRVRVANSPSGLSRASFTRGLNSGSVFALDGTDAEIEVTLLTEDLSITPSLKSVELRLLTSTDEHGFNIRAASDWSRGNITNLEISDSSNDDTASMSLKGPINVDGLYFSNSGSISEIDDAGTGLFGFNGSKMPISPFQALTWATSPEKRFNKAVSVVRLNDKNFLVSDLQNNRVLKLNGTGDLVKGFGSVNISEDTFFVMCSVYNPNTGILTIVTSQKIDKTDINLEKISVYIGGTRLKLNTTDTIILSKKSGNILEIQLSSDKFAQLEGLTKNVSVDFSSGAFPLNIELSDKNAAALVGLRGISVFIGDFTYIDGINHPVYASNLASGNWIVANSKIVDKASGSSTSISSVIEFSPDNPSEIVFTFDDIIFSDYSLGSVYEINENRLSIAGITSTTSSLISADKTDSKTSLPDKTLFIELTNDSGTLEDASSVVLASEDGKYGIKRNDTDASVIAINTATGHPSVGRYEYALKAEEGVTYTISWKIITAIGSTEEYLVQTVGPFFSEDTSSFSDRAVKALKGYRGTVVNVDKETSKIISRYMSPDGLYASDVDADSDGNLVISESDFSENGGRVIKLDSFGNIIFQFSNGLFGIINDAKSRSNGNIVLSL